MINVALEKTRIVVAPQDLVTHPTGLELARVDKTVMLDRVIGWLRCELLNFDPKREDNIEETQFSRLKAFAELAVFCHLYKHRKGDFCPASFKDIVAFLVNAIREPGCMERVRDKRRFLLFLLSYAAVEGCGHEIPAWRTFLQERLDQGYGTAIDRSAFRVMDLRYTLDLHGFKHRLPAMESIYRLTSLAKGIPLTYIYNADAYAITHALFYLSDFGLQPIREIKPKEMERCRWIVGNLLGMCVMARNWDLTGELLLSCHCLQWYPEVIYPQAWSAFARAQRADGSFEGPAWSMEHAAGLDEEARRKYDFERNYHTTLVAGFASLLT